MPPHITPRSPSQGHRPADQASVFLTQSFVCFQGNSPRKILVYNEMKKQCFSSPIDADNVCLWPDKPLSFKVTKEGQEAHILSFKSIADQIKFGVQVATGKAMRWPGIDGPMIADDMMFGTGPIVKTGSTVDVRFIAWAEGPGGRGDLGDEFDGNVAENAPPLRFVVGQKEVLLGLDEGAVGMRQGGIRRLVLPPRLAYGKDGVEGIVPPNGVVHIEMTIEVCNLFLFRASPRSSHKSNIASA